MPVPLSILTLEPTKDSEPSGESDSGKIFDPRRAPVTSQKGPSDPRKQAVVTPVPTSIGKTAMKSPRGSEALPGIVTPVPTSIGKTALKLPHGSEALSGKTPIGKSKVMAEIEKLSAGASKIPSTASQNPSINSKFPHSATKPPPGISSKPSSTEKTPGFDPNIGRKVAHPSEIVPEKLSLVVRDPFGKEIPSQLEVFEGEPSIKFVPRQPGDHIAELFDGPTKVGEITFEISPPEKMKVGTSTSVGIPLEAIGVDHLGVEKFMEAAEKRGTSGNFPSPRDPLTPGSGATSISPLTTVPGKIEKPAKFAVGKDTLPPAAVKRLPIKGIAEKEKSKISEPLQVIITDPTGKKIPSTVSVLNKEPRVNFTPEIPRIHKAEIYEGPLKISEKYLSLMLFTGLLSAKRPPLTSLLRH